MVQMGLFEVKIFGPGFILVYDVVCHMFWAKQKFPFESVYLKAQQTARTSFSPFFLARYNQNCGIQFY